MTDMATVTKKKRWYVVNVYSGFEKKVVQAITEMAERKGLSDYFEEFLVPCEEVVEVRRGAKVTQSVSIFLGIFL